MRCILIYLSIPNSIIHPSSFLSMEIEVCLDLPKNVKIVFYFTQNWNQVRWFYLANNLVTPSTEKKACNSDVCGPVCVQCHSWRNTEVRSIQALREMRGEGEYICNALQSFSVSIFHCCFSQILHTHGHSLLPSPTNLLLCFPLSTSCRAVLTVLPSEVAPPTLCPFFPTYLPYFLGSCISVAPCSAGESQSSTWPCEGKWNPQEILTEDFL